MEKSDEIIALIPARSGSKGIPNKNLMKIGDIPLMCWSIMAAKKCKLISRVIVSTDSEDYRELAQTYGAEVPFLRPKAISEDFSTDYEFVNHSITEFEKENRVPSYIVHLRPTTPFRKPEIIDSAIEVFVSLSSDYTSLRSVHLMSESAYKAFEMDENQTLKTCFKGEYNLDNSNNARQSYPSTFSPNGYVDVISTSFVIKNKKLHGNKVFGFETPVVTEVDSQHELNFLNFELKHNPEIYNELFRISSE